MTTKRGRPANRTVIERAKELTPLIGGPDMANLFNVSKRTVAEIMKNQEQSTNGDGQPAASHLPPSLPRLKATSHRKWLRDDVIAWLKTRQKRNEKAGAA